MDPKVTRHISANLEELNEKIAKLLKDPSEIIDNTSFNVDSMGLSELKAFAERGMGFFFVLFRFFLLSKIKLMIFNT